MRPTTLMLAAALAAGFGITAAAAQEAGSSQHHSPPAADAAMPEAPSEPGTMPMQHGAMAGRGPGMMQSGADDGRGAMQRCMEMRQCMGMMEGDDPTMDHSDMDAAETVDPVEAAFAAINRRMHRDMAVMPGDSPDMAFAKAMIAHHEGAIDMARMVLGFGSDPEIRKLAESIIAAQQSEIAVMQQWLEKQPPE